MLQKPSSSIKYPYLPEGREILFVDQNNQFMLEAKRIRDEKSNEKQHPTGAVVVKDGLIIGFGANQAGYKNLHLINLHRKGMCVRRWLHVKSGTHYWICPGCAKSKNHAENLAVKDALAKHTKAEVAGADLYLYGHWWCCEPCWNSMIGAGIKNVYLLEEGDKLFSR